MNIFLHKYTICYQIREFLQHLQHKKWSRCIIFCSSIVLQRIRTHFELYFIHYLSTIQMYTRQGNQATWGKRYIVLPLSLLLYNPACPEYYHSILSAKCKVHLIIKVTLTKSVFFVFVPLVNVASMDVVIFECNTFCVQERVQHFFYQYRKSISSFDQIKKIAQEGKCWPVKILSKGGFYYYRILCSTNNDSWSDCSLNHYLRIPFWLSTNTDYNWMPVRECCW